MLTAAGLQELPHLRLTLVAGREGADVPIRWAHSSDHPHPERWLAGGELLLKNGSTLPTSVLAQSALIGRLGAVGVSGVVIGLDPELGELPATLVRAADDGRVPLMTTPYSSSFVAIERAVGEIIVRDDTGRLAAIEKIYGAARRSLTSRDPRQALRTLARDLQCELAVVDAETLRQIFEPGASVPPELSGSLREELERYGGRIPGVVHLRTPAARALVVEVPITEPTLLVASHPTRSLPDLPVLQHLATAVAVLATEHTTSLEHSRRVGAELFSSVINGHLAGAHASSALAEHGVDVEGAVVVAIDGSAEPDEHRLHVGLARREVPHLMLRRSDVLLVLVSDEQRDLALLRDRLGQHIAAGVSLAVQEPGRLADAVREAVWSMRVARDLPTRTATYADAPLFTGLRDTDEARALVDRILGPLIAYDAGHGAELVHTLSAYLAHNRSWQRTADALSVHRQTVVYRLNKVGNLTGLDLRRTGDLAQCWLALRALEAVEPVD